MLTTDRAQPRHDQSTRLARRHLAPRTLAKLKVWCAALFFTERRRRSAS